MRLSNEALADRFLWEEKGYRLPAYDRSDMLAKTLAAPVWIHFGAGNLFKAFQADICQKLLDEGLIDTGIIAVERHSKHVDHHDDLTVKVTLKADGSVEKDVIGSVAETLFLYENEEALKELFEKPSLQMVSFTITEKGYSLPDAAADFSGAYLKTSSYMGRITALLYARYRSCASPLAMVSMDNCSHNGDKLKTAITYFAEKLGDDAFCHWLDTSVSFPWTMIDKITPGPSSDVADMLCADGLDGDTPFVNAEESEYLVIEDAFPNGRLPLEKAGIYFTDRETVDRVERMKVCTCLNPLHTALAIFGCLLGYDRIWKEMKDEDLRTLVTRIGYEEGLPVVTDPGIIDPRDFLDTVVNVRLPNPFMPDMPQRIATDTSQKLPIRFGQTIKAYLASDHLQVSDLKMIPLVYAGWLRYLMAVDDQGQAFIPSPDPLLSAVQTYLDEFRLGEVPDTCAVIGKLEPLLRNSSIFGVDLVDAGLAEKVCEEFRGMLEGARAVRRRLSYLPLCK